MKIDKANVFGTEYKINMVEHPDEDLFYSHADGRVNYEDKIITVWDGRKDSKRTLIHELIHAHLYESGMTSKAFDEDAVDYITTMFQRIEEILREEKDETSGEVRRSEEEDQNRI